MSDLGAGESAQAEFEDRAVRPGDDERRRRPRLLLYGLVFAVAGLLVLLEVQFTAGIVVLVFAAAYVARGLTTPRLASDERLESHAKPGSPATGAATTMVDVLVVDDQRTFRFPAVYARTVDAGLALLDEREWTEVWLDYDLGHGANIEPVVHHLEERASRERPLGIGRIYVHTSAPEAGDRMVARLGRWYDVRRVVAHTFLAPVDPQAPTISR